MSAHAQAAAGADVSESVPNLLSLAGIARAWREFWAIVGPGGKLHPAYFLEHKGHLVIEAALIVVIVYLALQHSFKVHPRAEDPLTDKASVAGLLSAVGETAWSGVRSWGRRQPPSGPRRHNRAGWGGVEVPTSTRISTLPRSQSLALGLCQAASTAGSANYPCVDSGVWAVSY